MSWSVINQSDYYTRMINRACEVVRNKHGLGDEFPQEDLTRWAEANEPELYARFDECDKYIDSTWGTLKEEAFKKKVLEFGKLIMEMLEKRHAWDKAQASRAAAEETTEEPPATAPASAPAHAFQPPSEPVQGRLI